MGATVRLKVTAGPLVGHAFAFTEPDTFIFGRAPECHAALPEDDPTASRHHFLLEVSPPAARLRDLGSLNGTHVNGVKHGGRPAHETPAEAARRPIPQVDLQDGDKIRIGATLFEVAIEQPCVVCGTALPAGRSGPLCAPCAADSGPGSTVRSQCPECGVAVPRPGQTCAGCAAKSVSVADTPAGGLEGLLAAPPPPPSGGEAGSWELGRLLGKGGMGSVHLARHRADGRLAALKMLLSAVVVDETARESFRREIEVTRSLRHPSIVQLLDHGSTGNRFWFAMEYLAGGSVYDLIKARGPLAPPAAVGMMLGALDGLAHAHARGFVHRDLKPENLLLADASGTVVKVTDFGLAKSFRQAGLSGLTATGAAAGTLTYMPREQLTHYREARPVSDVWSMGATLYYMLTRQLARDFRPGVDPLQIILKGGVVPIRVRDPRIPAPLAEVVDKAVSDDIEVRYADAGAFWGALAGAL